MACITTGLFLDAFGISIGNVIGEGGLLLAISRVRFIAHGVLIPLLFPICGYALKWKKKAMLITWIVTIVVMIAGLAEAIATVLEPITFAGVLRYMSAKGQTPTWATIITLALSFGTVIPLIICGLIVWIKQKTPFLFLSGLGMFVFAAMGPAIDNNLTFYITMFGEVLMVVFMFLYAKWLEKKEA